MIHTSVIGILNGKKRPMIQWTRPTNSSLLLRCGMVMEWCAVGCWRTALIGPSEQDVETSPSRKQSQEVSPHAKLLLPSTTRMSGIRSIQIDAAMLMIWCSSVVCCRVCCCCQVLLLFLFPAVISTYVGIHTWSDLDFSFNLLRLTCVLLSSCFCT